MSCKMKCSDGGGEWGKCCIVMRVGRVRNL